MKFSSAAVLAASLTIANGAVIQVPSVLPAGYSPFNQEQLELFRYSAHLSRAAFLPCPNPAGTKLVKNIRGTATGYISRDVPRNILAIVMRGSASPADFKVDGDFTPTPYNILGSEGCKGCMMHHGFQQAAGGVIPQIMEVVKAEVAKNPNLNILLTGHSLGGATCSLIAVPLRQMYGNRVTGVCFGSPRVGNAAFSDYFNKLWTPGSYFRVTSEKDGVPQQPPVIAGFKHAGNEYWMMKGVSQTPADVKVCNGSEDQTCNAHLKSAALFGINKSHLTYIVSFLTPQCGSAAAVKSFKFMPAQVGGPAPLVGAPAGPMPAPIAVPVPVAAPVAAPVAPPAVVPVPMPAPGGMSMMPV